MALSACNSNKQANKNESTSEPSQSASAEPGKFDKKLTIKAFNAGAFNPTTQMPDRENDPIRQMLEKAVNVDFQMTILPPDQQKAKLNSMIVAGDIPDMIFMTDRASAVEFYDQGIIAGLDETLKNYSELQNRFKPAEWEAMKYNGEMIGTPGYEFVSGVNGWYIRNDWLTKLNLKAPTTPDELLEVMKAFTFNDPDGNNKNDTYGFAPGLSKEGIISPVNNGGTNAALGWSAIFWMFGVNPGVVDQINGELVFGSTDPRTKEALEFINKMLDANVVDPDWVSTTDGVAIEKKFLAGKSGIVITDWRSMEPAGQEKIKAVINEVPDWTVIAPPKGPHGDQILSLKPFQNNSWAISKEAAKDPEKLSRIMELLQYWYTDQEFYKWACYGVKSIFWDEVDGKVQINQENKADNETIEKYRWATNYALPRKANDATYFNFLNPQTIEFQKTNQASTKENTTNPYVLPDPSDTKYADRIKYMNEMLLKFMIGKEPLSKWDDYLATLDSKFDYVKYKEHTTKQLQDAGVLK